MKPLKPWNLPRAAALCFVALAPWVAMDGAAQSASNATIGAALPCGQLKGLSIPDTTINIMKAEDVAPAAPHTVQIRPPLPEVVSVALPAYCRAEGEIDARVGSDG